LHPDAPPVATSRLRVFDFTGAEVLAEEGVDLTGMHKVDLSSLPKGMYLLQLTSEGVNAFSKSVLVK
jgi:hypothetical protein